LIWNNQLGLVNIGVVSPLPGQRSGDPQFTCLPRVFVIVHKIISEFTPKPPTRMTEISKIEYFRVPPRWLFVRIETSDGIAGWGESTLEGHTEAVEGCLEHFSGRLVGLDSRNIEDIWQLCYRGGFYRGGPVLMSALSGIDIALWDLKGITIMKNMV